MNDTTAGTTVIDYSPAALRERGSAWTQTAALLIDACRDLQSRKLFWLTLILSLLVAGVFAFVGIDEQGIVVFGWNFPSPYNSHIIPPAEFYKFVFIGLAIPFWLGWLATVLALVAVGGIFPDLIGGGSIDLYLCRPIGRIRLFLTKYAFGLLFTALQVLVFCAASFAIIGIKGGTWELGILLAVPLVTLFFSYLDCVCVLIGLLTRSTLAAILLTLLFWGGLWAIHNTDMFLTTFTEAAEARVAQQKRVIAFNDDVIRRNLALPEDRRGNVSQFEFQRDRQRETLAEYEQTARELAGWKRLVLWVKTPLPKTAETVALMSRWLVDSSRIYAAEKESERRRAERRARRNTSRPVDPDEPRAGSVGQLAHTTEVQEEVAEQINSRNIAWIIGTSLGFEATVLALAGWIFCRKDY